MYIQLILMAQSLEHVFGNRICWQVLKFLIDNPSGDFYEREIQRKVAVARASARKWLHTLEQLGFISTARRGRLKLHRLNRENPLVKQLKVLSAMSWLLPKLEPLKGQGEVYLYGSTARGEGLEDSDLDVLTIGRERAVIDKIRAIDGRIKVSFFTPIEWARMAREDPAFYERVERDKIRLV
jgi:predicted nucleotidyltransferase